MTEKVNGPRIRRLRMQRAWTQEQLAEKAALSARTVQRLENGEAASVESIRVLAAVFDVRPEALFSTSIRSHFSAPWSRKLQITTAAFLLIVLVATVPRGPYATWIGLGVVLLAALLSIRGYSVVDGKILVHRLGWSTRFDISQLQQIEANPGIMVGSVRLMGIGGLFAFIGTFRNELLGVYRAYATDGNNAVVLDLAASKVVVTPDSPNEFVEAVLAQTEASS
jgi:transcriptional regulator with XRE-family HTH domain